MSVRFREVRRFIPKDEYNHVVVHEEQVSRPLKDRVVVDVKPVPQPAPIQRVHEKEQVVERIPEQKQEINVKPVPVKVVEINVPVSNVKTGKEISENLLKKEFEKTVQDTVSKMEQEKREREKAREKALQLEEKLLEKTVKEPSPVAGGQDAQNIQVQELLKKMAELTSGGYIAVKIQEALSSPEVRKKIEEIKKNIDNAMNKKLPRPPPDFISDPRLIFVGLPEPIRRPIDEYVSGKIRGTEKDYIRKE
jgi:hypothetical protein